MTGREGESARGRDRKLDAVTRIEEESSRKETVKLRVCRKKKHNMQINSNKERYRKIRMTEVSS